MKLMSELLQQLADRLIVWFTSLPLINTVLLLIVLDIFAGLIVAANKKNINSTISFKGISRKVFMVLLIGLAKAMEPYTTGLPVQMGTCVATFFIFTEGISILENANALGVPIPKGLANMLIKNREDQQKRIDQKLPRVNVRVTPGDKPVDVHVDANTKRD